MTATASHLGAWLLLAGAIASATTAPDPHVAAPTVWRGYRLVNADFHVHAFPGDGVLAPWDIRREARRRGLDAVAITNHNQMFAARLDRMLFPDPPAPLTLMAEELTAPGYHVAAIGITAPVNWRLPLADAIRAIHAQGGLAIAAHPAGKYREAIDDEVLALLDGIEVVHPARRLSRSARRQFEALYARAIRVKPTIATIGSSDFHSGPPLGRWRTVVFAREVSQEAIFDALRAGRTVAIGGDGEARGPREWIAAAAEHAAATPPQADTPRHLLSTGAAWISLAFLVIFGRTRNMS